ncbi:MAG: Sir2 family NAD-dependent protein deacetylase [Burkholderiaceae bacterium]
MTDQMLINTARQWVDAAEKVVVLTGAGISTDSGIPDFRGPQGVWTKNPAAEKQSTIDHYMADAEIRKQAWQSRIDHAAWSARPNAGHFALVELETRGKLHGLITQNIDELHQIAGNSADKVIEVHGTVRRVVCMACGLKTPTINILKRVKDGEADPACVRCGGIQKSDTISFGQALVPEVIEKAMQVARQADVLLAVGSTLQVYPVAGAVPLAAENDAKIIIVNAQATAMDSIADALLPGSISEILPQICAGKFRQ